MASTTDERLYGCRDKKQIHKSAVEVLRNLCIVVALVHLRNPLANAS